MLAVRVNNVVVCKRISAPVSWRVCNATCQYLFVCCGDLLQDYGIWGCRRKRSQESQQAEPRRVHISHISPGKRRFSLHFGWPPRGRRLSWGEPMHTFIYWLVLFPSGIVPAVGWLDKGISIAVFRGKKKTKVSFLPPPYFWESGSFLITVLMLSLCREILRPGRFAWESRLWLKTTLEESLVPSGLEEVAEEVEPPTSLRWQKYKNIFFPYCLADIGCLSSVWFIAVQSLHLCRRKNIYIWIG